MFNLTEFLKQKEELLDAIKCEAEYIELGFDIHGKAAESIKSLRIELAKVDKLSNLYPQTECGKTVPYRELYKHQARCEKCAEVGAEKLRKIRES